MIQLPIAVGHIDLAESAAVEADPTQAHHVRLLVRLLRRPIGFVDITTNGGWADRPAIELAVTQQLAEPLAHALSALGLPSDAHPAQLPMLVREHHQPFTDKPHSAQVSVVVSTRERPESLRRCLVSIAASTYPELEIIVVDNAPVTNATQDIVETFMATDPRFRYIVEPRKGLSHGRNCGLMAASHELVAYTDDDVEVDAWWVHALADRFERSPDAACVTGLVPPATIERPEELQFDQRVNWSSNCSPQRYTRVTNTVDSPAYPFTAGIFGTGANFAVRRSVMQTIGGFDPLLGAGSTTRGGEDLDAFLRIILEGYALEYEPAAIVWHHHRSSPEELWTQMYGYGVGLSAFMVKHALQPALMGRMLARLPSGLAYFSRQRVVTDGARMPRNLAAVELYGIAVGPLLYATARIRSRFTR